MSYYAGIGGKKVPYTKLFQRSDSLPSCPKYPSLHPPQLPVGVFLLPFSKHGFPRHSFRVVTHGVCMSCSYRPRELKIIRGEGLAEVSSTTKLQLPSTTFSARSPSQTSTPCHLPFSSARCFIITTEDTLTHLFLYQGFVQSEVMQHALWCHHQSGVVL